MKVVAALVSAILCCSTFATGKADHKGDHKEVARHLQKRFTGHATYYIVGLGACGKYNSPGDFIVALNTPQYGGGSPGPQCFKTIQITAGGKSAVATIMDQCPGCGYGSLDFSQGLFEHFNPTSVGQFEISWQFLDGSGGGGGGNDDKPKTTSTYKPPPPPVVTTTHTTHTTHTTSSPTPHIDTSSVQTSSSSSRTKTSTTKKADPTPTSTSSSTSYTPLPTSSPSTGENFRGISQFILGLQNLLMNAAGN